MRPRAEQIRDAEEQAEWYTAAARRQRDHAARTKIETHRQQAIANAEWYEARAAVWRNKVRALR